MAQHYSIKDFFRQTPNALLARYFKTKGLGFSQLDEVFYGMRVKVLEVFDGNTTVGDTLMVWGDNGALCRH